MDILTRDTAKNKLVLAGEVIGDTFFKDVSYEKHFMRIVHGYGIQQSVYEEIVRREVFKVVIREKDTGAEWETLVSDWVKHGRSANYGHGKQRFLSLKYYRYHRKPEPISEVLSKRNEVEQGKLF